jgi:glycosyl transferase family 2
MPKTVRNRGDDLLGPGAWLGRKLRAPINFLLRRAQAELRGQLAETRRELTDARREITALSRELAELRRDTNAFNPAVAELHKDTRLVRDKTKALRKDMTAHMTALAERISSLETLLLEHPKMHTGNAAACGPTTAFPSPAVSIVLPTWNRAGLTGEAIESVLAQSFADWELIVVDDGSTDDTEQAVARFADSRIRYSKKDHAGQCAARNHALRLAKGALIAYLDSDNIWYPDFLACAVAAFAADPSMESAYGARVAEPPKEKRLLFEPFDREKLLKRSFIGMSSFIHRRALYERFGGFDESLRALEDWDLVLRYTQETPAHRLPVLAVRYRVIDGKRVTDIEALEPNHDKIARKWNMQGTHR